MPLLEIYRGRCHCEVNSFPFSFAGSNDVLEASVPGSSGLALPGLITQKSSVSGRNSLLGRSGRAGRRKQQETFEVMQW